MRIRVHERLTEETRERAELYVLGGMLEAEASKFEAHLESCEPCRGEVSALRAITGGLLLSAPEADPPPALRERVLERTRRKPFAVIPVGERRWQPSGIEGVEVCVLWVDGASERHTTLIRMQAGTSLPLHLHASTEECYVTEGDLRDGDVRLRAGDYVRFEGGTIHTVRSEEGCILLVAASLHDRYVQAPDGPDRVE